jgi:hypothetical protein
MSTIERPYYPGIGSSDAKNPFVVSTVVTNILRGNLNVILDVTITDAMTQPVVIKDPRIHALSYMQIMSLGPSPPGFYISQTRDQEADLRWTGTGWGSRDLRVIMVG